jgi:hypothetical protein
MGLYVVPDGVAAKRVQQTFADLCVGTLFDAYPKKTVVQGFYLVVERISPTEVVVIELDYVNCALIVVGEAPVVSRLRVEDVGCLNVLMQGTG